MPILDLQQRYAEVGRIRLGDKEGNRPVKTETFRFTSEHEEPIRKVAELYGGEVARWDKGWEVTIEQKAIEVYIPPGDVFSQWLEHWSKTHCVRRCDGQECKIFDREGNSRTEFCVCKSGEEIEEKNRCRPRTRFSVMLPNVPGVGVWRVETGSWHAARELLGQFKYLEPLLGLGRPIPATLSVVTREVNVDGKKQNVYIPAISVSSTIQELLTSGAAKAALPAPNEEELDNALPQPEPQPLAESSEEHAKAQRRYWALHNELGWPEHNEHTREMIHGVWAKVLRLESVESWHSLTLKQKNALIIWAIGVQEGEKAPPKAFKEYKKPVPSKNDPDWDPFADD